MKKIILVLIIVIGCNCSGNAQTYRLVKVNLGFGAASGSDNSGVMISGEPSFAIRDNLSVGLRLEQTFGSMTQINSEMLAADYYLSNEYKLRPYVGTGIGYYYAQLSGSGCSPGPTVAMSSIISSSNKIGCLLRAGFEAQHFRLCMEYNFVPTKHVSYTDTENGTPVSMTNNYQNNYFGISLGVYAGGGKK